MAAAIAAMAVAVTKVEAAVIRAVVVGTKAVPKTEKTTAIKVVEVAVVTRVAEAAAATKAAATKAAVATKDASETMRENALAELLSDLPSRSAKSVPKEGTTNSASTRLSILAKAVLPGGDAPSSP